MGMYSIIKFKYKQRQNNADNYRNHGLKFVNLRRIKYKKNVIKIVPFNSKFQNQE